MELRGRLAVLAIGQVHMPCSHARMTRAVQVACKPAQDRPPSSAELESHRGVELPRKGKALKNQHQLQRAQISVNRHHSSHVFKTSCVATGPRCSKKPIHDGVGLDSVCLSSF